MSNEAYLGNPNLKKINIPVEYTEEQIKELAPHTYLIQAKTYYGGAKWPAFDQINIDYQKIGELMRENNYRGYISLEFEGNELAETAVPKSLELLRNSFYYEL